VKKLFLPSLAVAAIALAGCGGSAHNTTPNPPKPPPVTKDSFDADLSSLCTRANNAFGAAHNVKGEVAVVSRYVALFASLKPPPQLQSLYAQYVAVLRKELAALKQGNQNELFKLAKNDAKPLVTKIGATGCVTSS
jgi:hypothetical protein